MNHFINLKDIPLKDLRKILLYSITVLIFFIFVTSHFKLGNENPFHRLFIKTSKQITKIEINNNQKQTVL